MQWRRPAPRPGVVAVRDTVDRMAATCAGCGLDVSSITAPDTAVAVRSYPRRFAAVLALPDDADTAIVTTVPPDAPTSALGLTDHVAATFERLTRDLRVVLVSDAPSLGPLLDEPWTSPDDPAAVLTRLASAADALASALDDVPADGWGRVGRWADGEQSVLEAARAAVHEGSHRLRDVRRLVEIGR